MSLPRYPDYRDSTVPWLRDVPTHWDVIPLKYAVDMRSGGTPSKASLDYWDGDVFWASAKDIKVDRLARTADRITQQAVDSGAADIVPSGAVLVVVRGMILARSFPVAETQVPMAINQDLKALMVKGRLTSRFVAWFLRGSAEQSLIRLDEAGHGTKALRMEAWSSLEIAVPKVAEQLQISNFLDRETQKIDALIAEQEKLIALLAEKRQATITHAVTRGLSLGAPTKDTGIPWVGKVPLHWDVIPLKHLVTLRSGGTPSKENLEYWDGSVPWASAKDMKSEELRDTVDHLTHHALESGAASLLPVGTVVVVVRGMILARAFPVVETRAPIAINQDLKGIQPKAGLDSSFLAWVLRGTSNESLQRLDEAGHGTKALRMDSWTSMEIPIPPEAEQREIVRSIVGNVASIDQLKNQSERAIDLLKERRSALITAAVTGQIDVRNAINEETA